MEKTVIEALEGAVSQAVPCQIIVSDDASDDRGYELALEYVRAYAGPHQIIVRRNDRNVGLCAHIATVAPLTVGSILVFMAGDDVSLPTRVERLLTAFAQHPDAYAVGSSVDTIDERGAILRRDCYYLPSPMDQRAFWLHGKFVTLLGASMAVRRELLVGMPPLQGIVEDNMLTLRATLFGNVYCLRESLVLYRRHGENLGDWIFARNGKERGLRRQRYERTLRMYREIAADHERCLFSLPHLPADRRAIAEQIIAMYRIGADSREALLHLPRHRWFGPIWRGIRQRGMRRRALEQAFKLLVPRRWLGL